MMLSTQKDLLVVRSTKSDPEGLNQNTQPTNTEIGCCIRPDILDQDLRDKYQNEGSGTSSVPLNLTHHTCHIATPNIQVALGLFYPTPGFSASGCLWGVCV